MDGQKFAKMCRDVKLVNNTFKNADADLVLYLNP